MNTNEPLTITTTQSGPGRVVLVLSGPCDYETVADLRQAADEALNIVPTPQCLTLDFAGVDACDSSGLSTVIWIKRCTVTDGVRLHLVGFNEHQRHVIQLTGMDAYLADALTGPCQDHGDQVATATGTVRHRAAVRTARAGRHNLHSAGSRTQLQAPVRDGTPGAATVPVKIP
ncbi:STAS domain-containing protein [Streptacidiphilus sp. PAMC 29251]